MLRKDTKDIPRRARNGRKKKILFGGWQRGKAKSLSPDRHLEEKMRNETLSIKKLKLLFIIHRAFN